MRLIAFTKVTLFCCEAHSNTRAHANKKIEIPQKFGVANPTFNELAGKTEWKYRGQLTPKNKRMDCEVHIKSVEADGKGGVNVVADGFLYVDKLRVYAAKELRLRIEVGSSSFSYRTM